MIAIIDDELSICNSLERLLRSEGYQAYSYTSSGSFLAAKRLHETDCIILDIRMPGQNGLDFQDQLREDGYDLPIIFITGYLDDQTQVRAMAGGAADVIEKPYEDKRLIDAIKSAMQGIR